MGSAILLTALISSAPPIVGSDQTTAFERSLRAEFRAASIQHCVSTVKTRAAAGFDVAQICACATDKVLAAKSVAERNKPSSEVNLMSVMMACIMLHPPQTRAIKP